MMNFIINALQPQEFELFFEQTDIELEKQGIKRMVVDQKPGFPCRVSLEDANIGEEVLLVPFEHHKTNSPYQAKGPIFIRKGVNRKVLDTNEIPLMLHHRLLSFRGYDKNGFMKAAITEKGDKTKNSIEQIFENSEIAYIHIHNASPGCYNCVVNRIN